MSWSKRTKRLKRELDEMSYSDPAYCDKYNEWDRSMGIDVVALSVVCLAVAAALSIAARLMLVCA